VRRMSSTSHEAQVIRCPACDHEVRHARYCEHCGAPLPAELAARADALTEPAAHAGSARLEIDAARVLQQNAVGVLELRLTNTGAHQAQVVMVEVDTPVVDAPLRCIVRDIRRGRHMPLRFSVIPLRHGEAVCRVRVKVLDTAQVFGVSAGEFTIVVNPPHVEETTLQFVIKDSDVVGDFENVFTQKRRRPRDVMQPRRRAVWVPIQLVEQEHREVRPVPKTIVDAGRLAGVPPIESAALRLLEAGTMRTVALFARPQLAFGRSAWPDPHSREQNDVVLRLMPDSAATRDLSRRIHRFAFQLRVGAEEVELARLARREGRIAVDSVERLVDGQPIDVGGLFELTPRIVRDTDPFRWERFALHRGTGSLPEIELIEVCVPSAAQVLGVVLRRSDEAAELEEYVQVRRHVTIGASTQAAIVLHEGGVAPTHARLIARGGVFFIEHLGSDGGTWVNERRLGPNEIAPLVYGDHLMLGKAAIAFEPFQQQFGDDDE
jgi:hypothetical protein